MTRSQARDEPTETPQGRPVPEPQGNEATTGPQGDETVKPQGDEETLAETKVSQAAEPQGDETAKPKPTAPDDNVAGWKATAQKWQNKAKANHSQLEAAELALRAATTDAVRYRVALESGLAPELAKRLVGGDEEALREDAELLRDLVQQRPAGAVHAAQGSGPNLGPLQTDDLSTLLRAAAKGN